MNPILLVRIKAVAFVVGATVLAMSWWYLALPKSQPVGTAVVAKEDARVKTTPTAVIPAPHGVKVLVPAAKRQLNLPTEQQDDITHQVTAAVTVPSSENPEAAIAILDVDTGTTEILTQKMETPLLAAEQRGQIWMGYGMKNGGIKVGRLSLREDLVQLKSIHLGINAALDTDGTYFLGGGVAYRW